MAVSRIGIVGAPFSAGAGGTTSSVTTDADPVPQSGDVLVFGVGSSAVAGTPTYSESPDRNVSWTNEENLNDGTLDLRLAAAYGICNENLADGDVLTATHGSTGSRRALVELLRGVDTASPIAASPAPTSGTGTSPASGTGTLPANGGGIAFLMADTTSDPTGLATGWNISIAGGSGGANRRLWLFYKTSASEVVGEQFTCTIASVDWLCAMILFNPVAAAGGHAHSKVQRRRLFSKVNGGLVQMFARRGNLYLPAAA